MRHVFDLESEASPAEVWRALTDPELTRRYYFGCSFESSLKEGAPYSYRVPGGPEAEKGTIAACEPGRRLALRARYLFDPRCAGTDLLVTWEIAAGERTRIVVTCEFDAESAASTAAKNGLPPLLKGLKQVLEGSGPVRLERISKPVVRDLVPELRGDWLSFFDGPAFQDNPAWGICYCSVFHKAEDSSASGEENRAFSSGLVECGRMKGLLAYVDGKPAGWCNAAPRSSFAGFAKLPHLAVDDAERVGSIVCFVVAAPYRRHGVARALLEGALERFRAAGLAFAEAYPPKSPKTDAEAFRGPLALYEKMGFTRFKDTGRSFIVRKAL